LTTARFSGRAATAIAEYSASAPTRMIVVPASGDGHAPPGWNARAAEDIAEGAPLPTLVVRDSRPLLEWLRDRRTLHVVCAYDFTACADAALNGVKALRQWAPCDVTVIYVDQPFDENIRRGLLGRARFDANAPEVQRAIERDLEERVTAVLGTDGVRLRVEGALGRPDSVLLDVVNQVHASLIVVGSHQWHGIQRLGHFSVSRAVLRHAGTNVLVVPGRPQIAARPPVALRRVLAVTDFTASGNEAIRHALALGGPGATIHLLHVVAPDATGDPANDLIPHPAAHQVSECTRRLRSLVPEETLARGLVTEFAIVAHRDVATAIVQTAERIGAHVICLATHHARSLTRFAHKSVASQVLRKSQRPVLLVQPTPP
jgi:nucleotide-binding universal stress UspA family protein